jgi:hypothetical protein
MVWIWNVPHIFMYWTLGSQLVALMWEIMETGGWPGCRKYGPGHVPLKGIPGSRSLPLSLLPVCQGMRKVLFHKLWLPSCSVLMYGQATMDWTLWNHEPEWISVPINCFCWHFVTTGIKPTNIISNGEEAIELRINKNVLNAVIDTPSIWEEFEEGSWIGAASWRKEYLNTSEKVRWEKVNTSRETERLESTEYLQRRKNLDSLKCMVLRG